MFPTAYDGEEQLLADLQDQRTLILSAACTSDPGDTTLVFETVVNVVPNMFLELGTEHVKTVSVDPSTKSIVVERAVLGTQPTAHAMGDAAFVVITAGHLNSLRDAALRTEKYGGLVGLDAGKPVTPETGEVYIATDTEKVYVCIVPGVWEYFAGVTQHSETLVAGENDDHLMYLTQGRLETVHDDFPGEHVTDGDDHDHRHGVGAGRIDNVASVKPAPVGSGRIVLVTDTDELYVTVAGVWVPITGAPPGAVAIFSEAAITHFGGGCPPGWTRYTALDGRIPRGAPTDVVNPLQSGGVSQHSHTYSQVPAHSHTVPELVASSSTDGSHSHVYAFSTLYQNTGLASTYGTAGTTFSTNDNGSHSHDVTYPQVTSGAAVRNDGGGVAASATSGASNNMPPYAEVVFCQKL